MKNKARLLCTFTNSDLLEKTIKDITNVYLVCKGKILVIKNVDNEKNLYCIYNVEKALGSESLRNTILIQKKKGINVLYTINALNQLIWVLNDGENDKNFEIPWNNYRNTFLLLKGKELQQIKTELYKIIKVN